MKVSHLTFLRTKTSPVRAPKDPLAMVTSPELGRQLTKVHIEKQSEIVREEERLQAFLRELADRD